MTLERKLVIGLEDITGISFECSNCHSRFSKSYDAKAKIPVPARCMACASAFPDDPNSAVSRFVGALEIVRASTGLGCKVVLEIDAEKLGEA
jgi:hypothetical protein